MAANWIFKSFLYRCCCWCCCCCVVNARTVNLLMVDVYYTVGTFLQSIHCMISHASRIHVLDALDKKYSSRKCVQCSLSFCGTVHRNVYMRICRNNSIKVYTPNKRESKKSLNVGNDILWEGEEQGTGEGGGNCHLWCHWMPQTEFFFVWSHSKINKLIFT